MIANPAGRLTEYGISDSTIYLNRHRRLSGRDELHVVETIQTLFL